ncbi:MAG TPA: DUF4097 family beta strand repeat-containing protein [Pyrinomonadaceae bacterium]|jgi:hypothetical protein
MKLIIALLIAVSGVTAAPQAVGKFNELRTAAENWTRLNLLNGVLTVSAHEKQISESALFEASGATRPRALSAEEFRWNGRVAAGRTVEIKGVNGNVRAEPSSGSEVEVVANKHAKRSNPSEVQIKVIEHEGGVTICAVYPSGTPGRINECTVGERWSSHTRNNDVSVDFTVRVPAGLRFAGRTVNGEVSTGEMNGDVEAYTVNGGINISATGYAEAKTVNGSISATMGNANWPRDLEFETVNGDITLNLPEATSVTVDAETLNGGIHSDFPVTVQGRLSRRRMTGTIGDGRHQLRLKTVNGSINMRRGQQV